MAQIIVHAGMPKTGSSSIQAWLAKNTRRLREERNVDIVVWRANQNQPLDPRIDVQPYNRDKINSAEFVHRYSTPGVDKQAVLTTLLEGLERSVRGGRTSLATGEILCRPFFMGDQMFLGALERLASEHTVRVAYYVRPQHTALEAAWRQWGFRSGLKPSEYLMRRSKHLNYLNTLQKVRAVAPSVSFEMRLFHPDVLTGGDVVLDFLDQFLGLGPHEVGERPQVVNPGVPLDIVNALTAVPRGVLWKSQHDNKFHKRIRVLVSDLEILETEHATQSRRALRQYCHERFEADNRLLIREIGAPDLEFVPSVSPADRIPDVSLEDFDGWWKPRASAPELALLYRALALAIGAAEDGAQRLHN